MSSESNGESPDLHFSENSISSPTYDNTNDIDTVNLSTNLINESSIANKMLSSQNATNSHPLMYSPTSPISTDYPDLIPEQAKHRNYHNTENVVENYDPNALPDCPPSPSAITIRRIKNEAQQEIIAADVSDNENDNDNSVYEARLSSNLQNVSLTMNEKEGNLNFLAHGRRSNKLKLIKVIPVDDSDVSSIDSITDSLKSEDIQSLQNDFASEPIEPLSANEEKQQLRHFQCMSLPDGEQRSIDMRVIEPYKRVLSHGGYLRAGGHTAIVVFSSCFLPDRSRVDYDYVMDNLFLYVLWTLDRLVTDDYVLAYLHGGATRLPSFSWFKRCYHMIGRKLRKNLLHLYLVHPTLWIKTMLFMAKPFISSKFYRKITYVGNLKELYTRIPSLECNAIPDKVKAYDSFHYGS